MPKDSAPLKFDREDDARVEEGRYLWSSLQDTLQRLTVTAQMVDDDDRKSIIAILEDSLRFNFEQLLNNYPHAAPAFDQDLEAAILDLVNEIASDPGELQELATSVQQVIGMITAFYTSALKRLASADSNLGLQLVAAFPELVNEISAARRMAYDYSQVIRSYQLDAAVERATEVAETIEERAGVIASLDLWAHFDAHATAEERRADHRQLAGMAGIAGGILVAAYFLAVAGARLDWSGELAKLLLTVPLFGLSGYLFREAGKHREVGRAARDTAVRLKSFRLFSEDLSAADRQTLRMEFGRRVFAEGRNPLPEGTADVQDVTALLSALTAALGAATKAGRG